MINQDVKHYKKTDYTKLIIEINKIIKKHKVTVEEIISLLANYNRFRL
jgi:hypothetical protein